MKFDALILMDKLSDVPSHSRLAEELGFDGLWTHETAHNPYFPLVLAAEHTQRVDLGTAIAVAFPRSPTITAQIAWDLAAQSDGRFILGLGTQVRAHIERRFGVDFEHPVDRLRDYILAMRALWTAWQTGGRLNYRGKFYRLTLMTPFFAPAPIENPDIPVYIAGVNRGLCHLAGELCQGFHVHPFHSPKYLAEAILPWIEEGAAAAGRRAQDVALVAPVFVIPEDNPQEIEATREAVRRQIAFYASTPTYKSVLDIHGWGWVSAELGELAIRQKWDEMSSLISDDMLEVYAVQGRWADLPGMIKRRYGGLVSRVMYYMGFEPGAQDARWRQAATLFHAP
ncbi:MAG: TIGR03617 family F420-dependent LLM class oxidoreductase [Anaerolineae bacterium]